jgi:hypothetical protein
VSLFERVGDLEKVVQRNASSKTTMNTNAGEYGNGEAMASRGRGRSGRIRGHNRHSSGEPA